MKELDECLKLNRERSRLKERIQELKAAAEAPKNQIISDMPRGSGSTINAIERYIIKIDELEQECADIDRKIAIQWSAACNIFKECSVSQTEQQLMRFRFKYGLPWKDCRNLMESSHGKSWDMNRIFRTYRKVLSKCTK